MAHLTEYSFVLGSALLKRRGKLWLIKLAWLSYYPIGTRKTDSMSSVRVMCTLSAPITVGLMIHWQAEILVQWTGNVSLTPSEILLFSDHLVIETQSSMEEWHCSPSSSSSSSSISALASGKKDKTRREGEREVWRSLEVCSVSEEPEEPRLLPESEPSSSSYLSIKDMLAVSSVRLVPVKGGSIKLWNV